MHWLKISKRTIKIFYIFTSVDNSNTYFPMFLPALKKKCPFKITGTIHVQSYETSVSHLWVSRRIFGKKRETENKFSKMSLKRTTVRFMHINTMTLTYDNVFALENFIQEVI